MKGNMFKTWKDHHKTKIVTALQTMHHHSLWFCNDYYDILDYTIVDYKSIYSYERQYVQNLKGPPQNQNCHSQVHVSSKGKDLRVEKKQLISKKILKWLKKIKTCSKLLNWRLKIPLIKNLMKRSKKRRLSWLWIITKINRWQLLRILWKIQLR